MSEAKFYVLADYESSDAFIEKSYEGAEEALPKAYDTEAEAVAAAKEYSGDTLVLKSVALVTEVTKYAVKHLK
jgi:hypothetical protein